MTNDRKLTDSDFLVMALRCLEHARKSTAIRDCQCASCKGFMQESGELLEAIEKATL